MSPRASNSDNSPAPDVYVGLLFIGVAALAVGCVLLWRALETYQFDIAP